MEIRIKQNLNNNEERTFVVLVDNPSTIISYVVKMMGYCIIGPHPAAVTNKELSMLTPVLASAFRAKNTIVEIEKDFFLC